MSVRELFDRNREWASRMTQGDPEYFRRLADIQAPRYLWIGCSDSRVPANEICGLQPGEVFVHRNVANVVVHTDLNCLSVMQFAIDVLKIEDVIVCGHFGCGGVRAALEEPRLGLIDNWLRHIQDVRDLHGERLAAAASAERWNLLCALNVIDQVRNVTQTTVLREAWKRGQAVTVHGWVYDLHDGLLRDLGCTITGDAEIGPRYREALARLGTTTRVG